MPNESKTYHKNTLNHLLPILILLFFYIENVQCFSFKQLGRSSASKVINQRTSYTFVFDRTTTNTGVTTTWGSQTVPANGNVTVQFPSQFVFTGAQTCDSISIISASQLFNPTVYTCTLSGNQLIFSGALTLVTDLFIKTVTVNFGNVLNPSPAIKTGQFTGYLGIDVAVAYGGTWIQFSPASFSSCQLTFGNGGIVNRTSPAIFDLTLLNQLNTSSSIRVTFPPGKVWQNDISQIILPVTQGTMSCSGIFNTLSSPICMGNYNAFTVLASSIFSSVLGSGQRVSFQINNFVSPPSLEPSDLIKITSMTNGFQVDTCTTTVSGLQPQQLTNLAIVPLSGSMIVNQQVGIAINMTFSDTVNQVDTFRITFPSSLKVVFNNVATSGPSEGSSSLSGQVLSVSQNVFFQVTYWADHFLVINFYTMSAPPFIKESDPITVEILRNGYQKMIGSTTVKALQSTVVMTVTPQSLLVNTPSLYLFTITLHDSLTSSGWLQMTFPASITLPSSITSISATGTNMRSIPSVSVDLIQQKLTITSLNSSLTSIPAQTFNLTLGMITNPGTTKPTSSFTLTSYYQAGTDYLTATGTASGITATGGVLGSANVLITKSSDVVLASPVDYTISFLTTYPIPQNGIIKFEIPTDIKLDLTNLPSNCFQQVNSSALVSATCSGQLNSSTNKYQLTISSIALNSNLASNSNISITLQGICTNPDTTRNVLGFSINTFSSDGYLIEGASTGISIKASTPAQCVNVNVGRLSQKNSEVTNYTVSFKQSSNLQPSSYLTLTIPSQLLISPSSICVDLTGVVLQCNITNNIISVQLPSSTITNMTLFGITLTSVTNIASYQPLGQNFTLLTKTPDNISKYCQYNNLFSIQNNIPSAFLSINGTFTPRIYYELTSLIIDLQPSSRIVPSYLVVSLATQLTVQTLTCSFQGIAGATCTQTATNTIKISGSFTSNTMQLTIGGIRAPKYSQNTTQYSSVSSFTSGDYKIDESTNLITFQVKCTLPCKTCNDTNPTQCLSCYQDITISTSIYYMSSLKTCYSTCPSGYYSDSATLSCIACDALCNTCDKSSVNCTTCKVNSTAKYFFPTTSTVNAVSSTTGTCLSTCPNYFYSNLQDTCVACELPCNDCTSKTVCVTCASPFYKNNGSCVSQCPSSTTIPNSATRTCDVCSSVCATCSLNVNNCTTCSYNAAYYNGSCVASCPPPLVVNAGLCAGCNPLCKQCSILATNCTKCDTTSAFPYLYNFTCLSDCPSTYYKDLLNGACRLCSSLNIGCAYCSSVSACISCDTGFVFLSNKCYNYTPSGYFNNNGYATACSGDCATCVDFASKCTSCKTLNLDSYTCVSQCPSGKVAVNKTCISCQSPCLTCSNIATNCTACIPNLTPAVFLNNFYCTSVCPDYTYPNSTTSICSSCQSPCLKCLAQTQCTSCVNGQYLLGTSCLANCPPGYIGLNKVCQPCTYPCMTCQVSQTLCLSCEPTYYLYNSSSPTCIQDCSTVNLYPNPSLQICTGCQAPCITCSTTSTTCTSCQSSVILFNNDCITSCPSGFYQSSLSCIPCPSACATCTSSTICQSCASSFYFLLNFCIAQCPSQYPVITSDGKCQQCSDSKCDNCTQNDYCQQCMQPYFLYLGTCVERCPTNYNETINATTNFRQCVYAPPQPAPTPTPNNTQNNTSNNTTEQAIVQSITDGGNIFPVPFIIAAAFIGVATIMSKFQNSFTFTSGVLYSLWGFMEWASVATMLWFFYQAYSWNHIEFYIIGGSFAFLYLLNFLALMVQNIYFLGDMSFNKWLGMGSNRCFYYFLSVASFLTTHKLKNFMFCKMFNFLFLKARLDSVQQFRVFNAFSFLSFLSSAGILFGMGLVFATYHQILDQKLMAFIDATVLTAVNIIIAILNGRKDSLFFEQKTEQGFIVHKRIQDYDEYLYGGIVPFEEEQKLDQYETTGKKLMTFYETRRYNDLPSESSIVSEESVRHMNVSVQAESILGEQSVITHLDESVLSGLDFFERKDISIQFDSMPPEKHDKSISMMHMKNHSISIQMDHVSQNEISVQVDNQREQVSVQYAPNLLDQSMGMSREHAEISIQANPCFDEVSIQYSAKPVFVNIDQEYQTENQGQDEISEGGQIREIQENQRQYFSRISRMAQTEQSHIMSLNQSHSQLTSRIKKSDNLLRPQLQFDIDQKLKKRDDELRRLEQERRDDERMRIISDFQKKQLQEQKPINYQVSKVYEEAFVPEPKVELSIESKKESVMDYEEQDKQGQLQQYQEPQYKQEYLLQQEQQYEQQQEQPEQTTYNQQSGTIMDSRFDILNNNGGKQFSSNQSRVQRRLHSQDDDWEKSIGGEKSQQQFIEMLSGKKLTTNQDQSSLNNNYLQQYQNKQNTGPVFTKNKQQAIKVEQDNQLQPSNNSISLNMTEEFENNYNSSNKKTQNPQMKFKFASKDQHFDSGTQEFEDPSNNRIRAELSNELTKSISTKNMTGINRKQHLSKGINQRESLIDSSRSIQNSFVSQSDLDMNIINAPIQPLRKENNSNKNLRNNVYNSKDQSYEANSMRHNFPPNPPRNLKSATVIRAYEKQHDYEESIDDSIEHQYYERDDNEKQQPLPLPENQFENYEMNDNEQIQFGEAEKVLISPFHSEQIREMQEQARGLPSGVNKNLPKLGINNRNNSKGQNKSTSNVRKPVDKKSSRSREKPMYNELLNPSTSRNRNITKQLQKEEMKAQNRKKNLELMQGMLQRPTNSRKGYNKEDEDEQRRTNVQKIYLNRQNFMMGK